MRTACWISFWELHSKYPTHRSEIFLNILFHIYPSSFQGKQIKSLWNQQKTTPKLFFGNVPDKTAGEPNPRTNIVHAPQIETKFETKLTPQLEAELQDVRIKVTFEHISIITTASPY